MDPNQHNNVPSQTDYNTQHFDAPPSQSGAGQQHQVSLAGMNVQQGSRNHPEYTQQNYPPPPPSQQASEDMYSANDSQAYQPPPQQQHVHVPQNTEVASPYEQAPPLPQRHQQPPNAEYQSQGLQPIYQPPPKRLSQSYGEDDPSNPIHYTRDPHKLIAYLIPFPKPHIKGVDEASVPLRFLIYTPPPPPLQKPAQGEKEAKIHKVQRKWQEEVRNAKTSTAKTASWQGIKSKATRGISKAVSYTTSSNLDFLGRVSDNKSDSNSKGGEGNDNIVQGGGGASSSSSSPSTHKTIGVEEMILIHPSTIPLNNEQMRTEFVNTMLRTKSKAQRDTIIATGLMPVAYGIDILATLVWPFGGLGEIDTVWAYASFRGAKTARSVTKRLTSSSPSSSSSSTTGGGGDPEEKDTLRLTFRPSPRLEILSRYLAAQCHKIDQNLFPGYVTAPTETDVLQAIGWNSSQNGGGGVGVETRNWEDEQWEINEVKDDFKLVMSKGAKEWRKWAESFAKDPIKAVKK